MNEELKRHKAALERAVKTLTAITQIQPPFDDRHIFAQSALKDIDAILNPPLKMETVSITGWFVVPTEGHVFTQVSEEHGKQMRDEGYTVVSLAFPVKRPVKRPVVREVEVEAEIGGSGAKKTYLNDGDPAGLDQDCPFCKFPECHGKTGTLIFRWTE